MSFKSTFFGIIFSLFIFGGLIAQPSGGPYGPVQKTYELPDISGTLFYVASDGNADVQGTTLNSPTTLSAAIARVETGDAIILRGGIYRTGDLELNQHIIMQPYMDEQPVIKGTYIADEWELVEPATEVFKRKALWRTKWDKLFPSQPDSWWRTQREGRDTPLHKFNNDMVFADGRFLQSAGWYNELNDNNFYIDYAEGYVYVAFDPTGKTMEITGHNQGLIITARNVNGKDADGRGPTIKGLTFTQYAFHVIDVEGYFPEEKSDESNHGKDVVGTTFENCTISYGGRVGAFLFGDHMTMKSCLISDTSTEGVYILSSSDVLLEKNIFTRNNIENIRGYYPAAVKIFNQSYRVTANDNLVINQPESNGIWYDVGNVDGVFTNNWLEGVGSYNRPMEGDRVYPSRNAFFFEISKGVRVAGNVLVNNDHGMMILNASDAKIYNNTFVNSMAVFGRTRRGENVDHFGWHITTGPGLKERINHEFSNNVMVSKDDYNRPLVYIWQLDNMCEDYPEPQLSVLDHNAYVTLDEQDSPLIWMAGNVNGNCVSSFDSSTELHDTIEDYASNSMTLHEYHGPLFKSIHLKNFELMEGFRGESAAGDIPAYIKEIMDGEDTGLYLGTYPYK